MDTTKQQIDSDLADIGKDRKWLAEVTGYSYFSVRDCLAPDGKKLSRRMADSFRSAITKFREEVSEGTRLIPPDVLVVELDSDRYKNYSESAKDAHQTLKEWAVAELDKAAAEWAARTHRANLSVVADDTRDYGSKPAEGK